MKAVTALQMGKVETRAAYGQIRTDMWNEIVKTVRGASEKIVEATIVVLIAALCITAVLRVHEGSTTTACFNEAIVSTIVPMATIHE